MHTKAILLFRIPRFTDSQAAFTEDTLHTVRFAVQTDTDVFRIVANAHIPRHKRSSFIVLCNNTMHPCTAPCKPCSCTPPTLRLHTHSTTINSQSQATKSLTRRRSLTQVCGMQYPGIRYHIHQAFI